MTTQREMAKNGLLLGAFALVAGLLLSWIYGLTAGEIAARQAEELQASLEQVIPPEWRGGELAQQTLVLPGPDPAHPVTVYRAILNGQVKAVAFEMSAKGYNGAIHLMLGVDAHGVLTGVRTMAHTETPGLGDRIETAKGRWILVFTGKSLEEPPETQWKVKKDGGVFDQFTGATITPRGVVQGVREGLLFFRQHQKTLLALPPPSAAKAPLSPTPAKANP